MKTPFEISIQTPRLCLQPITMDRSDEIFRVFTGEVTRYMFPKPPDDISETEDFIRSSIDKMHNGEEIVFTIIQKQNSDFIGCAGIHSLNTATPVLGIWTKVPAHGNGYGKETIHALYNWLCENNEFDYVIYPVDRRNTPSLKIPESLGGEVKKEYRQVNQQGRELQLQEYHIYRKS